MASKCAGHKSIRMKAAPYLSQNLDDSIGQSHVPKEHRSLSENTSQAKPMVFAVFKGVFDFSGVWFGFFIVSIQRECPTCLSAFRFSGRLEGQNHEKQ